jgi:DNA repair ATPase RecN
MFPIKRIEQSHYELNNYYSQVISFQDKEPQYQDILVKFSKILLELDEVIEEMRKYNNNTNNQIVNLNKYQ